MQRHGVGRHRSRWAVISDGDVDTRFAWPVIRLRRQLYQTIVHVLDIPCLRSIHDLLVHAWPLPANHCRLGSALLEAGAHLAVQTALQILLQVVLLIDARIEESVEVL